jgi:hypothetical protein
MSPERVTKRRRLDQAGDLSTPCPKTAVHLPTIYNAHTDANTWNWNSVEPDNTQLETAPPECQICCQLDLWPMFAQDASEISAGSLSKYLYHSCPFADLVQEALRLRCDSSWATVMDIPDPDTSPDLLLKSRGWVFIGVPGKKDFWGIVNQKVKNHHPRVILAINKRPQGAELLQTRKKLVDSLNTPYILTELDFVDNPWGNETAMLQEPSSRSWRSVEILFDCSKARQWLDSCKRHKICKKNEKLFQEALF